MNNKQEQLYTLLNRLVDDQADSSDTQSLNSLLRESPELIHDYVNFMSLHAQMFWDAGLTQSSRPQTSPAVSLSKPAPEPSKRTSNRSGILAVSAALLAVVLVFRLTMLQPQPMQGPVAVPTPVSGETVVAENDTELDIDLNSLPSVISRDDKKTEPAVVVTAEDTTPQEYFAATFTDGDVQNAMNALVRKSWEENDVQPSPVAADDVWLRRVYLTVLGRIPSLEESKAFLTADTNRKDASLLDSVIGSGEAADFLASTWTNLLIGRSPRPGVNRKQLEQFLTTSFRENRPWMETVQELITARGRSDQNGATNFLLAHLNNQATPATAVTARLFLGERIQCMQCHDHPFAKDLKQDRYWALNAFFKDTERRTVDLAASSVKGREVPFQLVDRVHPERMTFYETRTGLTQAVLPKFAGVSLPAESSANRRKELARLLEEDSSDKVARAMVNRMWAHFFGYGFTPEVDDIGPHTVVSHPEVMNLLTEAFVKSDYDLKRLMTWIGGSEAWRLSSDLADTNRIDRPEDGEVALFSRVYLKRMTPEQVYDSIRVAIRSSAGLPIEEDKDQSLAHRREWVAQFTKAYETDENDESLNFGGTIGQAMVMMNGVDVADALRQAARAINSQQPARVDLPGTLDQLSLAMMTRQPTSLEAEAFRSRYRSISRQSRAAALPTAVEDMMWAYLNCSEFVMVR